MPRPCPRFPVSRGPARGGLNARESRPESAGVEQVPPVGGGGGGRYLAPAPRRGHAPPPGRLPAPGDPGVRVPLRGPHPRQPESRALVAQRAHGPINRPDIGAPGGRHVGGAPADGLHLQQVHLWLGMPVGAVAGSSPSDPAAQMAPPVLVDELRAGRRLPGARGGLGLGWGGLDKRGGSVWNVFPKGWHRGWGHGRGGAPSEPVRLPPLVPVPVPACTLPTPWLFLPKPWV